MRYRLELLEALFLTSDTPRDERWKANSQISHARCGRAEKYSKRNEPRRPPTTRRNLFG